MEVIQPLGEIDDLDIQSKVESLVGKGAKILDCVKSSWFQQEQILLVDGYPVPLEGEEGQRIKVAMEAGQIPPHEMLSEILRRAGILREGGSLETTSQTRCITKTRDSVILRNESGKVLDGSEREVEDCLGMSSETDDIWSHGPVNSIKSFGKGGGLGQVRGSGLGSNGSSSWSSSESDEVFDPSLLSPSDLKSYRKTVSLSDRKSFFVAKSPLSGIILRVHKENQA